MVEEEQARDAVELLVVRDARLPAHGQLAGDVGVAHVARFALVRAAGRPQPGCREGVVVDEVGPPVAGVDASLPARGQVGGFAAAVVLVVFVVHLAALEVCEAALAAEVDARVADPEDLPAETVVAGLPSFVVAFWAGTIAEEIRLSFGDFKDAPAASAGVGAGFVAADVLLSGFFGCAGRKSYSWSLRRGVAGYKKFGLLAGNLGKNRKSDVHANM